MMRMSLFLQGQITVYFYLPVEADQPDATRVMTAAPASAPPPSAPRRDRPAWLPWAGAALGVLLVVVLLAWLGQGDEPAATAQDSADEPVASASEQRSPSPTKQAAPEGIVIVADDYIGMDKETAKKQLEELGLKVKDEKVENLENRPEDTVADISPTGEVQEGDEILLSVWDEPVVEQVVPDDEKASKGKAKGHKGKGH